MKGSTLQVIIPCPSQSFVFTIAHLAFRVTLASCSPAHLMPITLCSPFCVPLHSIQAVAVQILALMSLGDGKSHEGPPGGAQHCEVSFAQGSYIL